MLVGMATLSPSFPPSGTAAFYFINRPPMPNILTGSVQHVHGLFGPEKNKENHFFFKLPAGPCCQNSFTVVTL